MIWCIRSGFQLPRYLPHPDKRRHSALTAPLTMRSAAVAAPLPHTPAKSAGRARVFRFAKRNESTARLRRAAALSRLRRLRARALPHFADPRQRNFSYRVSSHPLCTALQNLTEQLPLSGKALFSRIRSGFQPPRRLPHPDKRRHSALTAPLTMRSAAVAAPLPHTPAKSAGRARVFRFAKRNESTARLRRAAALSRLRRLRARALPHFADPRQRNFSYRVSSPPLCTAL